MHVVVKTASTSLLRVGTWVMVNDFRNPVLLAREAATLDFLSEGRLELGLGPGRADNPYASLGLQMDSGGVRLDRLGEAVRIINALFRGERVTTHGKHYSISDATLFPSPLRRLPILLAASGQRAIRLAGELANSVALGAGSRSHLMQQLAWLEAAAGERYAQIEIAMTIFLLPEGDAEAREATGARLKRLGMDLEELIAADSPHLVSGSPDSMAQQLEERREAFGLSYFTVGQDVAGEFAPVVQRLAGR